MADLAELGDPLSKKLKGSLVVDHPTRRPPLFVTKQELKARGTV